jgi:hypothetical protein
VRLVLNLVKSGDSPINGNPGDILCIKKSKSLDKLRQKGPYPLVAMTEATMGDYFAGEEVPGIYMVK